MIKLEPFGNKIIPEILNGEISLELVRRLMQ
jgi:hypothetical protein